MGCFAPNRTEVEIRLNEICNMLLITNTSDSRFAETVLDCIYRGNRDDLKYLLTNYFDSNLNNTDIDDIIKIITNNLIHKSDHDLIILTFTQLFLCKSTPNSLSTNFFLLNDSFRNYFKIEINYEYLVEILKFYVTFISSDILNAYKTRNLSLREKDNIVDLENIYIEEIKNRYIYNIISGIRITFDYKKFFLYKFDYLNHQNIRDELKKIFQYPEFKRLKLKTKFTLNKEPSYKIPTIEKGYNPYHYNSFPKINSNNNNLVSGGNPRISNDSDFFKRNSFSDLNLLTNTTTESIAIPKNINFNEIENYRINALNFHNQIRVIHGVPPLIRNKDLEDHSQVWAEAIAFSGNLSNSNMNLKGYPVGENIACADKQYVDVENIIESWYYENKNFNYDSNYLQTNCASFTQLIWKSTTHMGLGVSRTSSGKTFFVVNYFPAGNTKNDFLDNVYPPVLEKRYNY